MRVMDTQAYLDNICSLLQQGHTPVSIPVSGNSMCPFLHPGDQVFLEKPQGALKKGDVVLFTRLTGQYVLHRIRKVNPDGSFSPKSAWTEILIYPCYTFRAMDALITNFHLPESTLVMLVSAFAGLEHVLSAYEEAVRERYRFFSFGDAMYIG